MKITAAMFDDYGQQLHIENDVEIKDPGPNEVRVKIISCGICHTDMAFQYDEWKLPIGLPFVPGHEGAGIIEKTGPGVTKELFINNLQLPQDESENARRRKESMRASATDNNAAFADSDKPKVKIYL